MFIISKKTGLFLSIIFLILVHITTIMAQPPISSSDQFRKFKHMDSETMNQMFKKHINEKLKITERQSEDFWEIYDKRIKEIKELHKEIRNSHRRIKKDFDTIKDEDVIKAIDLELNIRQKLLELEKTSNKELLQIISPKQLLKLKAIEHRLRKMMEGKKRKGRPHGEDCEKEDRN